MYPCRHDFITRREKLDVDCQPDTFICTLLPPVGGVPLAMKCADVNMNCHISAFRFSEF
jgi:hypothetical protein